MLRTTTDFLDDLRSDLADRPDVDDSGNARDTLWSDGDLLRYLNSAAARLATDTLGLRRRFEIPTSSLQPLYKFPYWQIIDIIQASFATPAIGGGDRDLTKFDIDEGIPYDDYGVQYFRTPDFTTVGVPRAYTRDWDDTFLRLFPIPQVDGVLTVHAYIVPDQIQDGMPIPFQAQEDWDLLLIWAKKLAYAKQDADVLDLTRSQAFDREYKLMMPDRRSSIDATRRNNAILRPR